ncbi:acVLRF1 family peptidyl-tRNA hydrolase [Actinopolymorpha pittospori]|uniref:acVLRF1 family peptidyl-tRNA hydrolase n=1 Tax=Actinopolymorpha pittospori TaxID=648752 RepID=UPI003080DAE2
MSSSVPSASTSEPERTERDLTVGPERLDRWLAGFFERHGGAAEVGEHTGGDAVRASAETVTFVAADGARAECTVPFPPLRANPALPDAGLVGHATRDRRVGVLLVRMGGYAAGVFVGRRLEVSKVGARLVQGRTAAGGWSQQRFARRREKQAREAFEAAADVVARVLLPHAADLDAMVVGGDRRAVAQVLEDARLAPLRTLVTGPHLHVPDPKLAVLRNTPEEFRAVRIRLTQPA